MLVKVIYSYKSISLVSYMCIIYQYHYENNPIISYCLL